MHCLPPIGEHGNSVSCSCNSAGFPVGGSGDPFLNWPLKNTPQVQDAWSAFGNINPSGIFNLINSFSSAVFACDAVDNLTLIMQNAMNTNWDASISTVILFSSLLLLLCFSFSGAISRFFPETEFNGRLYWIYIPSPLDDGWRFIAWDSRGRGLNLIYFRIAFGSCFIFHFYLLLCRAQYFIPK